MGERGFSLIELLVVLAIMAVLLTVALPRLGAPARTGLRSATVAKARAALTEARADAMSSGRPTSPAFVPGAGSPTVIARSASGGPLLFFGDGSSTGGAVALDGRPLLAVDWFSGQAQDVRG